MLPSLQSPKAARRALDLAADGALPQILKLLEEDFLEDVKEVAFCHRRAVAEHLFNKLQEKNIPSELVHGLVPQRKRDERIQKARDSKEGHILVATIDSTSTGIDLSYASTATYVELPWELTDLLQSKERLYNFESMEPIFIRFAVAKGTTSELILNKLLQKLELFESVVGKIGDDKLKVDLLGQKTGEDALEDLCKEMLDDVLKNSKKSLKKAREKEKERAGKP